MRWVVLFCFAACGFAPQAAHDASSGDDGSDGSVHTCRITTTDQIGIDRGQVGLSIGGGTNKALACTGTDRLVGIALDMSDGPVNMGDTRSAHGIRIGCAQVFVDGFGGHTGTVNTIDVEGFGGAGFTPSTMTALARCPAGAVVSGLRVHGSYHMNLFLSATLSCAAFDANGQLTATTSMYIGGSLADALYPSEVQCPPGDQTVALPTDIGAGLDSLHVFCAATTCAS